MAGELFGIGMEVAGGLVNQLTAKQQYQRTKNLMGLQFRNQQALNLQGQQLQLDTWEKTNYPAQMEMLKKAGLNPGLMYAKGGAGGTTGGQGGGSASMGSVSQAQSPNFMNILAIEQAKAGIELAKAQANKTNVEANKIAGVDTEAVKTGISKMIAETDNEVLKGKLIEVQTDIEQINKANRQYQIDAEIANIMENANKLKLENSITTEAYDSIVAETKARAIGQTLENELNRSKIKLTDTEKQAITTGIVQKWTELGLEGRKLDQKDQEILINKFEAEIKANTPTLGQVAGGIAQKAYILIYQEKQ